MTSAETATQRARRSRFHRRPRHACLTPRDAYVLKHVFLMRFCPAQATYLFALAAGGAGSSWAKRLRVLFDAGWLTRLYLPPSVYVAGARWPVYLVESGAAARAIHGALPEAADPEPQRHAIVRLMEEQGISPEAIQLILRGNTDQALKVVAGEPSQVRHSLLGATLTSIALFGAVRAGLSAEHLRADGTFNLSFTHRKRGPGEQPEEFLPIEPDGFFAVDGTGYIVEAETGTSSRAKVDDKVRRYRLLLEDLGPAGVSRLLGIPRLRDIRIVFHAATESHVRRIASSIAAAFPTGTAAFLVTAADVFHLDYPHEAFRRNTVVAEAEQPVRLYEHLASLTLEPNAAQIEGRDSEGLPLIGYVPLFERGAAS